MFHFHFRNTLQMGISEIPTFFVVLQNDRFFDLDVIGSGTAFLQIATGRFGCRVELATTLIRL
jgi:hypothetical protein